MAALITLRMAITHCRAPFDESGDPDAIDEMNRLRNSATAICLSFIERDADDQSPAWTDATNPETDHEFSILQAAILRMLLHLWRWRGDDEKAPKWSKYNLPDDVEMLLNLIKDPTIA